MYVLLVLLNYSNALIIWYCEATHCVLYRQMFRGEGWNHFMHLCVFLICSFCTMLTNFDVILWGFTIKYVHFGLVESLTSRYREIDFLTLLMAQLTNSNCGLHPTMHLVCRLFNIFYEILVVLPMCLVILALINGASSDGIPLVADHFITRKEHSATQWTCS